MNLLKISHYGVAEGTAGLPAAGAGRAMRTGAFEEKGFRFGDVAVREVRGEGKRAYGFTVDAGDVVELLMLVNGSLSGHDDSGHRIQLHSGKHRYLYTAGRRLEWSSGSGEFHVLHITIARDRFLRLLDPGEEWARELKEKLSRGANVYGPEGTLCARMLQAMNDLFSLPFSGSLKQFFAEAKVQELIALQLHHSAKECPREFILKKKDRALLAAVHQYLTAHYSEEFSLKGLSKTWGINEFTLKKGFKSLYGKTVFDYLFELKMNHARRLLLEEGKLVCEVSRAVGYRNPNHFSTAFKKKFGVRPLAFRIPLR